ncbi:unnamed protein product [Paramecium sonneborni]|uniref:Protein kinase domain-containing protein n=1 Tax=Paramecium sonneborni TaxID=65129 RepID=A0A8S1QSC7_9CILI|nr:unnamed protein product [Paramecium sonneborni]
MIQEAKTISSSSSQETKGYFEMIENQTRIFSFEQRLILKLISENSNIFIMAEEVPYNISQIMNKSYLIDNHPIIGSGSFGIVCMCKHLISQLYCAVKVHQRCQSEDILQQVNEYKIQCILNKKFPQSFLLLIDRVYIIQESLNYFTTFAGMEMGITTLSEYVAKVNIEYQEFLSIYHSILQQILEMHSLRIAHRDIKPANIIYTLKGWILSDFGCSLQYKYQKGKYLISGTKQYLPKNLRELLKTNFSQIQCDQNLFNNDIYSFLITMLQIYKKSHSILQLQKMLDDDCLLKDLPIEFQIYGKSYNYIKLNVLVGLNKIPILPSYLQEKQAQMYSIFEDKFQNEDYLMELMIKQKKILKFSEETIWNTYGLNKYSDFNNYVLQSIYNTSNVDHIIQKYNVLLLNEFQLLDDKSLLEINSSTKAWQYNLIQNYYFRLGNFEKQYQACLEMQKYSDDAQIQYKLFEIECLIEQDQQQKALLILEELDNQQYLLDDVSYVKLELLRTYLEKNCLETVNELSKHLMKVQTFFQSSILIQRLSFNFSWIILQYNTLDNMITMDNLSIPYQFFLEQNFKIFGIQANTPKEIIKQLEQRGADKYGIKIILFILASSTNFGFQQNDKIIIDDLFEIIIEYYEKFQFQDVWEIYYYYSIYSSKKNQYNKALSLVIKAMKIVDYSNNLYVLQILFQQIHCLICLGQSQEYQQNLLQILIIIKQIKCKQSRLNLIKRIVRVNYLAFTKNKFTSQIFNMMKECLNQESFTEILHILYKLEWETVLMSQQPLKLLKLFNNKMLSICEYTDNNDQDILKCIQNIVVISRQKVNVDQKKENVDIAVNFSARLIQNILIFEDLFKFNQTETLNIQNESLKYLYLNNYFENKDKSKEAYNIIQEYDYYNNYK